MLTIHPKLQPRWTKFLQKWAGCKQCPCHLSRTQIVHYRGYLPCDVLFIGEAPGDSEDALGFPFVGPAGELFNRMLFRSYASTPEQEGNCMEMSRKGYLGNARGQLTYGVTNIVACRPKTPKTQYESGKLREPTKEEALACQSRLVEICQMATPKLIVCLGKIATKYLPDFEYLPAGPGAKRSGATVLHLMHPSAILRAEPSRQGLLEKRFVLSLTEALKEL